MSDIVQCRLVIDFVVWNAIEEFLKYLDALNCRVVVLHLLHTLEDEFMFNISVPVSSELYELLNGYLNDLAFVRSLLDCDVPE